MKRFDIVVPKPDNKDPEKTYWKNVGTLVQFDPNERNPEGGFILELHMFPATTFKVFKQKPRAAGTDTKPATIADGVDPTPASDEGIVY